MVFEDVFQELDYEGVPFRCHGCHSAEHLVAQCDRPFRENFQTEGRMDWSREGGASKKARESSFDNRPISSFPIHSVADLIPRVVQLSRSPGGGLEVDGYAQVSPLQMPIYSYGLHRYKIMFFFLALCLLVNWFLACFRCFAFDLSESP